MPGYLTKQDPVAIAGVALLNIRSLLDRQQFSDPLGEAERLGISSSAWPLFGMLWPSAAVLAAHLAQRPVGAERILEIGCGLALASLVGHRRGADITASDCHPLAEAFLQANLLLNGMAPMTYRHGHWHARSVLPPVNLLGNDVAGRYDLVIGSDLLYERDEDGTLAAFIDLHLVPGGEVWIVDPDRGNRPRFTRHMLARGFGLCEEKMTLAEGPGQAAYKGRLLVYRRP